mmetsp:Transcript_14277/g.31177  ORF Transcript_14277/g.31177 Transcript_14277/m.31177 type:complete len:1108 (+) Transcript_14277:70-3393(+)|eukprot:CAMPEP_0168812226 /NCGR_PEP_ID=MMETSP0726-20121227/4530_1 /TAXON_ID=265536 /ORGANISM="Amphiprora sp., Strain CCMP467" /LENGTH=1107 /DNA_ID=CAMNT_0008864311 /DNA_START=30 /DNA_END=3353 /DNA_ORIENTATION=-
MRSVRFNRNDIKDDDSSKGSTDPMQSTDGIEVFAEEGEVPLDESVSNSSNSMGKNNRPAPQANTPVVESESVVVHQAEVLTFVVLLYSAAGLGVAVRLLTKQEAEDDFNEAFKANGNRVIELTQGNFKRISALLKTLGASFISYEAAMEGEDFPYVTIPDFHKRTEETLAASNAALLAWCPLVASTEGATWNTYSEQHFDISGQEASTLWKPMNTSGISYNGYFAPQWQYVPMSNHGINSNLFDSQVFNETAGAFMSGGEVLTVTTYEADEQPSPEMSFVVPTRKSSEELAGLLVARLDWESMFGSALAPGTGELLVEVENDCGPRFSYKVNGQGASFFKEGTLFDNPYDNKFVTSPVGVVGDETPCPSYMTVYPTEDFREDYNNNDSVLYTSLVMVVFFVMIVAFLVYACAVRSRQKTVKNTIDKTTAIVSSIFPEHTQQRIYEEAKNQVKQDAQSGPTKSVMKSLASSFSTNHNRQFGGKPIADLFTECTILFADIVGFTAWSSTREPSQVFTLLEHIYSQFDEIAGRRRVFKVETVGDCYVAVTGLPEARRDHAVAMARFANDCMNRFNGLVQQLVVELGPDTEDLCIRMGMHSGPVTAGVLRGERARFQLFGDTVNTTARMESSGRADCIQVSSETAKLLVQANKGQWLTPREDTVIAKGKGEMKTFWLRVHSGSEMARGSSDVSSGSENLVEALQQPVVVEQNRADAQMSIVQQKKAQRLIMWNVDVLAKSLAEVVARRKANGVVADSAESIHLVEEQLSVNKIALREVEEIVKLPAFSGHKDVDRESELPEAVKEQLADYVTTLAGTYQNNPFHNFEHASHVTMSVTKLLSRIVAPDIEDFCQASLHDHTYGITSDPLTQFSVILSALIHDADHAGIPNTQLIKEDSPLAKVYENKSIAEQNSVDLAWQLLMDNRYKDLRQAIYATESELLRFRQLVVQVVLATDIMDKQLKGLRNKRWETAFSTEHQDENELDSVNRKATIVLEHLIQASDVAHTMQHWHIYRKWNMRLFLEVYKTYAQGRTDKDPSENWFEGEIGFFDFYIIPLAKKLKDCGVFGVSSDEYLNYALMNRAEWERRGRSVVAENLEVAKREFGHLRKQIA